MAICPKCGHQFSDANRKYIGPQILEGILKGAGGMEAVGERIGKGFKRAKGHTASNMASGIRNWVADADRLQQREEEMKSDVPPDQQRAILVSFALKLMESDDDFRDKIISLAESRGYVVRRLAEQVVEAECQRIS